MASTFLVYPGLSPEEREARRPESRFRPKKGRRGHDGYDYPITFDHEYQILKKDSDVVKAQKRDARLRYRELRNREVEKETRRIDVAREVSGVGFIKNQPVEFRFRKVADDLTGSVKLKGRWVELGEGVAKKLLGWVERGALLDVPESELGKLGKVPVLVEDTELDAEDLALRHAEARAALADAETEKRRLLAEIEALRASVRPEAPDSAPDSGVGGAGGKTDWDRIRARAVELGIKVHGKKRPDLEREIAAAESGPAATA